MVAVRPEIVCEVTYSRLDRRFPPARRQVFSAGARIRSPLGGLCSLSSFPTSPFRCYLLNKRVGAAAYNAVHTYISAAALAASGTAADRALLTSLAMIWVAHIGLDRLLGFGLRYRLASRTRICSDLEAR